VDQTLVLSDGRTLGYALWGEPGGSPVLRVGTSPGSRLLCPDLPATVAAGVRLITVDRPGSGRSDPDPHPGMARWVADTGALVDHLRLERLGLVGWSGGGQFALAAAAGLPDRVTSVALAGTPAPAYDDLGDWPPEGIFPARRPTRRDTIVGLITHPPSEFWRSASTRMAAPRRPQGGRGMVRGGGHAVRPGVEVGLSSRLDPPAEQHGDRPIGAWVPAGGRLNR
jgi:pimeloyl-ACP methyl ester carboxylesterase